MLAQQHVQHFLELAETAEPELWAQHTDVWLPRLDPEEANFRAALGWAIGARKRKLPSDLPVRSIRSGKSVHGTAKRVRGSTRRWLSMARFRPSFRAKALVAAGRATSWHSDWPTAIPLLEEAAELSRKLGD